MSIYFTSDTHFGHRKLAEVRGFSDVLEMDMAIIDDWNNTVKKGDTVYHLGDFSLSKNATEYPELLNGSIHLIMGNHDDSIFSKYARLSCFTSISKFKEIRISDSHSPQGRQHITLCHFALRVWNKSHYGAWSLFGHSHGSLPQPDHLLSMDVGVDATKKLTGSFRPISYEEVRAVMSGRTWAPVDHHKGGP